MKSLPLAVVIMIRLTNGPARRMVHHEPRTKTTNRSPTTKVQLLRNHRSRSQPLTATDLRRLAIMSSVLTRPRGKDRQTIDARRHEIAARHREIATSRPEIARAVARASPTDHTHKIAKDIDTTLGLAVALANDTAKTEVPSGMITRHTSTLLSMIGQFIRASIHNVHPKRIQEAYSATWSLRT